MGELSSLFYAMLCDALISAVIIARTRLIEYANAKRKNDALWNERTNRCVTRHVCLELNGPNLNLFTCVRDSGTFHFVALVTSGAGILGCLGTDLV